MPASSPWSRWCRRLLQALPQRWIFETLYALSRDPWNYQQARKEIERYEAMLDLLHQDRPPAAWQQAAILEVGCSVGAFTRRLVDDLAPRHLLAVDISTVALARARRAVASSAASFARLDIFEAAPPDAYDLVVVSDVLYYTADLGVLKATRDRLLDALQPGGRLLLANTRLRAVDGEGYDEFPSGYPLLGATPILECFLERFSPLERRTHETWQIDLLQARRDP